MMTISNNIYVCLDDAVQTFLRSMCTIPHAFNIYVGSTSHSMVKSLIGGISPLLDISKALSITCIPQSGLSSKQIFCPYGSVIGLVDEALSLLEKHDAIVIPPILSGIGDSLHYWSTQSKSLDTMIACYNDGPWLILFNKDVLAKTEIKTIEIEETLEELAAISKLDAGFYDSLRERLSPSMKKNLHELANRDDVCLLIDENIARHPSSTSPDVPIFDWWGLVSYAIESRKGISELSEEEISSFKVNVKPEM